MTAIDTDLLRQTWAQARTCGDDAFARWFYATLTLEHPELRGMFAVHMAEQRRKLMATLAVVVRDADRLDDLADTLQRLGADHATRYGVRPEHYGPVGRALLDTLAHFLGPAWTADVEAAWTAAYTAVADVMVAAAPLDPVDEGDPR